MNSKSFATGRVLRRNTILQYNRGLYGSSLQSASFQRPLPPSAFADLTIALRHNPTPTYHRAVRIIVGPCVLWLIYTQVYITRLKRKRAANPFNPPKPCFSRPAIFPRTTAVANSGNVCPDEPTPHKTEKRMGTLPPCHWRDKLRGAHILRMILLEGVA